MNGIVEGRRIGYKVARNDGVAQPGSSRRAGKPRVWEKMRGEFRRCREAHACAGSPRKSAKRPSKALYLAVPSKRY